VFHYASVWFQKILKEELHAHYQENLPWHTDSHPNAFWIVARDNVQGSTPRMAQQDSTQQHTKIMDVEYYL